MNPESCAPVTEDIPIEFPIRVSPFEKVKRSEKRPVPLLYEIPPVAEREVSPIFVAIAHERDVKLDETVHEMVAILVSLAAVRPERVEIFPVAVARFVFVICSFPERVFIAPERVFTVVVRDAREPETVVRFVFTVTICPERVAVCVWRVATDPDRVDSCVVWRATVPERVAT